VLLLAATGREPAFVAWQSALEREGTPFDALIATPDHEPITAELLEGTQPGGTPYARYQAVILSTAGLVRPEPEGFASALGEAEWEALIDFERRFAVRQLSAYAFPSAGCGLNHPDVSGPMEDVSGFLTPEGRVLFPYLRGPVTFDVGCHGHQATPLAEANFTTLLGGVDGAALLGVFTHLDGRQEMVQTFDGNPNQLHIQLLRHGQLEWVTRGTRFGRQRNYLEVHVDDVFLADDSWEPNTHATSMDPAEAIRMVPEDVAYAVQWSRSSGIRLDMLFNGGRSEAHASVHGSDSLLEAFTTHRGEFGWINHTFQHANLDRATRGYAGSEISDNVSFARRHGLGANPAELVTGQHSGLANTQPGSPGQLTPPRAPAARPHVGDGGLRAGTYLYAVAATNAHGETTASHTNVTVIEREPSWVSITWTADCHATGYKVYRRPADRSAAWLLIAAVAAPAPPYSDAGAVTASFADVGAAGLPAALPAVNTATLDPYAQNPEFIHALTDCRVEYLGVDASKGYPQDPLDLSSPLCPPGTTFTDGPVRAVPRYPTNIYYNVATEAQEIDEYIHLHTSHTLGGECAVATFADIVSRESTAMFAHVVGNDPRPHFFHQSNLTRDRIIYPVLDAVLKRYRTYFRPALVQLSLSQIGRELARQRGWGEAGMADTPTVIGYIEGDQVTVHNRDTQPVAVPLTGTTLGRDYGGSRSGWMRAASGTTTVGAIGAWPRSASAAEADPRRVALT
jgi:hypothetical protein